MGCGVLRAGVNRFQRSVAPVPFGELVMFVAVKKPKDKGDVRNRVGIMVGLVDRSDDVVIGTTERVVKARAGLQGSEV